VVDAIQKGRGLDLAHYLTSNDLLAHGAVELRSWLTLLGVVGPLTPRWVVYEPFYRGLMGMGVAVWETPVPKRP